MKTLIVFLSLQLIISPLGVSAQTSTTSTTTQPDPKSASQVAAPGDNPVYDSSSQHQAGHDFYAKQVLSMSTSIIGSNIISQCSFGLKIPSIATFMAGSLVYIASELAGAKAQNENHNKRMDDLEITKEQLAVMKNGGEVQREALRLKLLEEQQTSDYMASRRMWLTAVTAIYWTAMGLAIMEETTGVSSGAGVGTGTCTGLAAKYAAMQCAGRKDYPACYAAKYAQHMAKCTASMPLGWAQTLPNFANPASVQVATASCTGLYAPACLGYLTTYLGIAYANCSPLSVGSGLMGMVIAKAITTAYSMGITAAGGSPFTGYVTMMYALFEYFVPALAQVTMAAYNYPIPRAATFGASAALVTMVTAGLITRQEIAEQNIEKLNAVYTQFRVQTDETEGLNKDKPSNPEKIVPYVAVASPNTSLSANLSSAFRKSVPEQRKSSCISGQNNELEISTQSCNSPLQIKKPNLMNFTNSDYNVLTRASNLSQDLAQAISSGNTDKAKSLAGELGSMLGSIREATLKAQNQYNQDKTSRGEKAVNFQQEINKELAAMKEQYFKALEKNEKLSGVFKAQDLNLSEWEEDKSKSLQVGAIASLKPAILLSDNEGKASVKPSDQALSSLSEGSVSTSPGQNDDLITSDNPEGLTDDDLRAARINGYHQLNEELKLKGRTQDGISYLSESSIFKQISNRYFRSLGKILNRKEPEQKPVPKGSATQ